MEIHARGPHACVGKCVDFHALRGKLPYCLSITIVVVQETGEDLFPNDLEGRIDAIMNELIQDELIRDMLDPGNDIELDEGIELNMTDEIYNDIEPFDFALEVGQDD